MCRTYKVLKVIDAGEFWVSEIPTDSASDEAKQFQQLSKEMNRYAEAEKTVVTHVSHPVSGRVYLGKCSSQGGVWCRVKVNTVLHTAQGLQAKCHLVDYGTDNELIPLWHLLPMPDSFLMVPFQAKKCILHGVRPVSMQLTVEDDVHMVLRPSPTWDNAAKTFVKKLVDASVSAKIEVLRRDDTDTFHISLHLIQADGGSLCVNDVLVRKKYACYDSDKRFIDVSTDVSSTSQSDREKELGTGRHVKYAVETAPHEQCLLGSANRPPQGVRHSVSHPISRNVDTQRTKIHATSDVLASASHVAVGRSLPLLLGELTCVRPGLIGSGRMESGGEGRSGHGLVVTRSPKRRESSELVAKDSSSSLDLSSHSSHRRRQADATPSVETSKRKDAIAPSPDYSQKSFSTFYTSGHSSPSVELLPFKGRGRGILGQQIIESERSQVVRGCDISPQVKSPEMSNLTLENDRFSSQIAQHGKSSLVSFEDFSDVSDPVVDQLSTRLSKTHHQQLESASVLLPRNGSSYQTSENKSLLLFTKSGASFTKMNLNRLQPEDFQMKLYGIKNMKFIHKVENAPFSELVKRILHTCSIEDATRLQRLSWPAILRGHNVFGVGFRETGGKTLAYVPPLVTMLSQKDSYSNLPISCGPYALIVAAGMRKAADIHRYLARFGKEDRIWRFLLLSPECDEDNMEIRLLNGCEVLVATPPCLLRMLSKRMTNLTRLCYLILDDLDILLDIYPEQIVELMALYMKVIGDRDRQIIAPNQLIAMSSVYNRDVEQFYKTHMADPVVIIASQIEAAYAANVKQMAVMCYESQRAEQLISQITDNLAGSGHKILVFVSGESEVDNLYSILISRSIVTLRAHHGLSQPQLNQVIRQWTLPHRDDSKPVLICTDSIITMYDRDVCDATCVIHYDLPQKKSELAKRLWCMRNTWRSPLEDNQAGIGEMKQCLSYFYVTESSAAAAGNIVRLLERCQSDVPQKLRDMADHFEDDNEGGHTTPLCDQLKAFGRCCSGQRCQLRHRIVNSLDCPGQNTSYVIVPLEGQVKILVTHVVHASRYYARLLEVTDSDGQTRRLSSDYVNLLLDMSLWYNKSDNRVRAEHLQVNMLYAFEDAQHVFSRVLLVEFDRSNPSKVKVLFVDTGVKQKVDRSDMLELPGHFTNIPLQAVEIYVCRVKPKDRESTWTNRVNAEVAADVENKELIGNIVLSLGCTLWLDPLVSHARLSHINLSVEEYSVRGRLLESHQSEQNPEHLHMLYKLCSGILDLPQLRVSPVTAYTAHNLLVKTRTRELPMSDDYTEVLVQAVDTPDLFYVQLKNDQESIEQLERDLNDFVKHNQNEHSWTIRPSMLVLAKFPGTNTWNRAKVSAVLSDQECDVFFVDFGETEVVKESDILPMPTRFQIMPFYAIECCLIGVEPVGVHWTEDDGNVLYEVTRRFVNGDEAKVLLAKVVSRASASFSGQFVYGLELLDTSMSYSVNISHELVLHGRAKFSSQKMEELFPWLSALPPQSDVAKIVNSCIDIIKSQDTVQQIKAAEVIQEITRSNLRMRDGLVNADMIQALSLVLQVRREPEIVEIIVTVLVNLVKNSECLCKELWNQGGFNSLIHLLNTASDNDTIEILMWAFQQLVTVESCVTMLNKLKTYHVISELLSKREIRNKTQLLDVLSTLLKQTTERDLIDVDKCGCLASVCNEIQNSCDPHSVSICLRILEDLASSCASAKEKIKENNGVKAVCNAFKKWTEAELKKVAVRTLKVLASGNLINRDIIKEHMDGIDHSGFEEDILKITGKSLLQQHPVQPTCVNRKLENKPLSPEHCSDDIIWRRSEKPEIKWLQDKWNVLLTVSVQNVKRKNLASFTEDTITFRVVKECTEYAFSFLLYEIIVPSKCEIRVRCGSVLIGLRKKTRGLWPRLLREKQKLPYLSLDFSRFEEDSSDDSDKTEDEPQEGPLSLSKKNGKEYVPFSLAVGSAMSRDVRTLDAVDDSSASCEEITDQDDLNIHDYFDFGQL